MSDTPNSDNALPPKLNLSKKIAKPVAPAPISGAGTPSDTPDTSRIKLTAKPRAKSAAKPLNTANPKPLATPAVSTAATKPTTVLKAKQPVGPATVKLKAKPRTGARAATTASPTPVATKATETVPAKPAPLKAGGTTLTAKTPTLKAKPTALKPKTVSLKPKPAMGIKRGGVDLKAPAGSKRATSKIPFSSSAAGDAIGTKTIKIKPSAEINRLTGNVPVPAPPTIDAKIPDPKRQTSRISLESALGTEEESTGPKTIRLKRPSKTPTVKVSENSDEGSLSKTSKIEMPKDAGIPATQKKTIKIKRPSQKRTGASVSVKRKSGDETAESSNNTDTPILQPLQPLTKQKAPDTAHWTFLFSSIAALIIACVFIYVLCAQVFGPNISLTKLAYAAPDVELPWPGRIAR